MAIIPLHAVQDLVTKQTSKTNEVSSTSHHSDLSAMVASRLTQCSVGAFKVEE